MNIRLDMPFHLDYTLSCGQVFRWEKVNGWWYGIVNENVLKVRQEGDNLVFRTYPEDKGKEFIEHYFRFDDDLLSIFRSINKDSEINKAIRALYGLRIVRQNAWECLISYVCATNASIPAIGNMIRNLGEKFGKEIVFDGKSFFTFPEVEKLASASVTKLQECKLGYRARYVLDIAMQLENNPNMLEELEKMNYADLRHNLLSLPGVGPKVADCVSLFSFGKLEAFPIDVWVRRVMYRMYLRKEIPRGKNVKEKTLTASEYTKLSSFARDYFGNFAGYAQEYLFFYVRRKDDRNIAV